MKRDVHFDELSHVQGVHVGSTQGYTSLTELNAIFQSSFGKSLCIFNITLQRRTVDVFIFKCVFR